MNCPSHPKITNLDRVKGVYLRIIKLPGHTQFFSTHCQGGPMLLTNELQKFIVKVDLQIIGSMCILPKCTHSYLQLMGIVNPLST